MQKKVHYAWLIMISCCAIAITGMGLINGCAGIFLRPVSQELGVGIGTLSLYITLQALVMSFMVPLAAKIMQKYNINLVLSICFIVQCGTFMMMSQFTSVTHFYIAGIVIGLVSPFIVFLAVPTLMNAWFQKYLGTLMGITLAFSGLSGAIFNPIGSYFITMYGWRTAYLLLGAIGLIIVLPFMIFIVRKKPSDKGLSAFGAEKASASLGNQTAELKGISSKHAIKTGTFYMAVIAVVCLGLIGNIVNHLPGFIVSLGISPTVAATGVSAFMIGVICGKILVGFLNDKIGIVGAICVIGALSAVGTMLLLFHPGGIAVIIIGTALLGTGAATATVLPPLLVRTLFGQKDYATIYSYLSMGIGIIGALSVSIYGFIYDAAGTYVYDFMIVAAAIILAMVNIALSVKSAKKLQAD